MDADDHPTFGRRGRRQLFTGPRPITDLVLSRIEGTEFVLVGLRGDGYVRLDLNTARDFAFSLLELAGVPADTEGS